MRPFMLTSASQKLLRFVFLFICLSALPSRMAEALEAPGGIWLLLQNTNDESYKLRERQLPYSGWFTLPLWEDQVVMRSQVQVAFGKTIQEIDLELISFLSQSDTRERLKEDLSHLEIRRLDIKINEIRSEEMERKNEEVFLLPFAVTILGADKADGESILSDVMRGSNAVLPAWQLDFIGHLSVKKGLESTDSFELHTVDFHGFTFSKLGMLRPSGDRSDAGHSERVSEFAAKVVQPLLEGLLRTRYSSSLRALLETRSAAFP